MTRAIGGMLSAAVALVGVLAATASADHQTAKNGCTSLSPPSGSLTSDLIPVGQGITDVRFRTWWEKESVNPTGRDQLFVDASIDGGSFQQIGALNEAYPTSPPVPAAPDVPFSNIGPQQKPNWESTGLLPLPSRAVESLQLRFRFVAGDSLYNGFRGWGVDDIEYVGAGTPAEDFSDGLTGWTATPHWRTVTNSALPQILSPTINPNLVTLGAGDDGFVPADDGGSQYAWYGQPETGTYCGADAAHDLPPPPPPPPPPAAPPEPDPTFPEGTPTGRTLADLPPPKTSQTVNVGRVRGEVLVRYPQEQGAVASRAGARTSQSQAEKGFVPLAGSAQIPVGSTIDTTEGVLRMQSTSRGDDTRTQTATFFLGMFEMRQRRSRRPVTEMVLKGGSYRDSCRADDSAGPTADDARHRRRSRRRGSRGRRGSRVRRLWGRGRGRYRTRGRYSSAAVRGTKWVVEERCNGTFTRVATRPRNSRVAVRDFVTRKTIILHSGDSYFAPRGRIRDARISNRPRSTAPGGRTIVTGRGWGARRLVTLRVRADGDGSLTRVVRVRASRRGGFRKGIRMPRDAGLGTYTIHACNRGCALEGLAALSLRAP